MPGANNLANASTWSGTADGDRLYRVVTAVPIAISERDRTASQAVRALAR